MFYLSYALSQILLKNTEQVSKKGRMEGKSLKEEHSGDMPGVSPFFQHRNWKTFGWWKSINAKSTKTTIILATGNNIINALATIFRGVNLYWFLFDHERCQYTGLILCTFCAMRSLSQWLSKPKGEINIVPMNYLPKTLSVITTKYRFYH